MLMRDRENIMHKDDSALITLTLDLLETNSDPAPPAERGTFSKLPEDGLETLEQHKMKSMCEVSSNRKERGER
jgi:hypothetical protein